MVGIALLVAGAGRAAADPVPVRSGKVVLPITGLAVDLPKDPPKDPPKAAWEAA